MWRRPSPASTSPSSDTSTTRSRVISSKPHPAAFIHAPRPLGSRIDAWPQMRSACPAAPSARFAAHDGVDRFGAHPVTRRRGLEDPGDLLVLLDRLVSEQPERSHRGLVADLEDVGRRVGFVVERLPRRHDEHVARATSGTPARRSRSAPCRDARRRSSCPSCAATGCADRGRPGAARSSWSAARGDRRSGRRTRCSPSGRQSAREACREARRCASTGRRAAANAVSRSSCRRARDPLRRTSALRDRTPARAGSDRDGSRRSWRRARR